MTRVFSNTLKINFQISNKNRKQSHKKLFWIIREQITHGIRPIIQNTSFDMNKPNRVMINCFMLKRRLNLHAPTKHEFPIKQNEIEKPLHVC